MSDSNKTYCQAGLYYKSIDPVIVIVTTVEL